jgi:alkylation response protein AidB-like acyl-CoA dehydrogenase
MNKVYEHVRRQEIRHFVYGRAHEKSASPKARQLRTTLDLQPNADDDQVIDSAAVFLKNEFPLRRLHRVGAHLFNEASRRRFADLGFFGIGVSDSLGGSGFSAIEEALFFREMGRVLAPVDVLIIALAARICLPDERRIAAELFAGLRGVCFCTSKAPEEQLSAISGSFQVIGGADAKNAIIVGGEEVFLVDVPANSMVARSSLDKSVSLGTLTLDSAPICARASAAEINHHGRLLVSAMLIGICEAVTTMLVDYAKVRETFGRPIGAYQAVRHPCADMAVRTEAARAQMFYAAVALRDGRSDAALQVNAAKILADEAAVLNVDANIQLHGGIATTDEHDAHLFMKRAHLLRRWFGTERDLVFEVMKQGLAVD